MSEQHRLFDLIEEKEFAAALKYLNSCNDEQAREQLVVAPRGTGWNALMQAVCRGTKIPEELIRAMVKRGRSFNYINSENACAETAAMIAALDINATVLELLLTLSADPQRCREQAQFFGYIQRSACLTVLDRFEQRTTLACCLRHYDELHQESPLYLHPGIAALEPFAKILHDLHGINGDMHSISRMIISYI
jgi:hypothetical protein